MHFPIIELKDKRIPKDERMNESELYDDLCVNYFTDYFGDEYSDAQRREYLNTRALQQLLNGIAEVDAKRETITFLDEDTIRDTIMKEMLKIAERIQNSFLTGSRPFRPRDVQYEGEYWRDYNELFHIEGRVTTSGGLISDSVWYAGKTLYIGAIFDAHC